jgi:RsmE family RNA methyltransferase
MNIILLKEDELTGKAKTRVRLEDRRFEHIRKILKPAVGDELSVGLLGGGTGKGRVTAISDKAVDMEISLTGDPPPASRVKLILALPRPVVLRRILTQIASLGVKYMVLLHSGRVEKGYWKSPALDAENIRQQLMLGLEQAQDTVLPEVLLRKGFRPFVRDELPGIVEGYPAFLGHVGAVEALPRDIAGAATLVIGPEGGFLPHEVKLLEEAGCRCVNFGPRILRVETAVVAALARLGP